MVIDIKEKMVTVREAATECGRNPETIRRWIWAGKLPAEKLGNQLYIKIYDLNKFYGKDKDKKNTEDWLIQAKTLRERMQARGVKPINSGELIRSMREARVHESE